MDQNLDKKRMFFKCKHRCTHSVAKMCKFDKFLTKFSTYILKYIGHHIVVHMLVFFKFSLWDQGEIKKYEKKKNKKKIKNIMKKNKEKNEKT